MYKTLVCLSALSMFAIARAMAQETPADAASPVSAEAQESAAEPALPVLEDVVVTATRRETRLSQVPLAVTEVSGERLDAAVIRDTQSLQMEVPSLNVTVSGSESSGSTIRIRSVGTTGSNAGFESAVGVFIDGVYRTRPGLALNDLFDVERIEVLRGPQGTLLGKNTSVGAIHVLTRPPVFAAEAEAAVSYGGDSSQLARVMVNTPVVDNALALRLSGQYNVRDGHIRNQTNGDDYNDRNRYALRAQALYEPLPSLSIRLIADTIGKNERCCAAPYTQYGPTAPALAALGATVFDPPQEYRTAFDAPLFSKVEEDGVSTQIDWDLAFGDLRALLNHRDASSREVADGDYSDADLARVTKQDALSRLTSAEVSLHGVYRALDWVAGVFYGDERVRLSSVTLFGADAGDYFNLISGGQLPPELYPEGTGQTSNLASQDGESISLFTHNVVDFGRGYDMTLGLRALHESKDGGGETVSNSPSCAAPVPASAKVLCGRAPYTDSYDDDRVTGTLSFGKHFNGGSYAYAGYSSGFKAGGINLNPPSVPPDADPEDGAQPDATFKPETVDAYEIGLTVPLLDRRIMARTALFWMDFDDFQINSFNGLTFTPSNIPSARSRGAELESTWRATDGLLLRGSATYADARYGDDVGDPDLNGDQLTNAPKWVGQVGASYVRALPWWSADLFASAAARYQSEVNTGSDLDPAKRQGGYTLINTRLGLRLPRDLELSLWGTNVTDKYYRMVIFDAVAQPGSYNGYPGVPRLFGLELRKEF